MAALCNPVPNTDPPVDSKAILGSDLEALPICKLWLTTKPHGYGGGPYEIRVKNKNMNKKNKSEQTHQLLHIPKDREIPESKSRIVKKNKKN